MDIYIPAQHKAESVDTVAAHVYALPPDEAKQVADRHARVMRTFQEINEITDVNASMVVDQLLNLPNTEILYVGDVQEGTDPNDFCPTVPEIKCRLHFPDPSKPEGVVYITIQKEGYSVNVSEVLRQMDPTLTPADVSLAAVGMLGAWNPQPDMSGDYYTDWEVGTELSMFFTEGNLVEPIYSRDAPAVMNLTYLPGILEKATVPYEATVIAENAIKEEERRQKMDDLVDASPYLLMYTIIGGVAVVMGVRRSKGKNRVKTDQQESHTGFRPGFGTDVAIDVANAAIKLSCEDSPKIPASIIERHLDNLPDKGDLMYNTYVHNAAESVIDEWTRKGKPRERR